MWPFVLAAALPALVEQVGKTVRKLIDKQKDERLQRLEARVAELEMRARWSG